MWESMCVCVFKKKETSVCTCSLLEIRITLSALTANSPVWMGAVIQTVKTKPLAKQHIMQR